MSERCRCRWWAWPWELRRRGVLGINARNNSFLSRLNPRASYPLVDNKVLAKAVCESRGIPVPKTYAVLKRFGDIRRFGAIVGSRQEFVVKPARGSGGRGVLVIASRNGDSFETASGKVLPPGEVRYHLSTTLSGLYSLGGRPDWAMIEERIELHPLFADLAVGGTPDIRIIVYRGVPVMGMLRLPTRASEGRANLHQGAVGAGIDLATGRTGGGVWRDRMVSEHPDTGAPVGGVEVPQWGDAMRIAVELSEGLRLGYFGVDLLLDARRGVVVLEANARPGLAIQIANGCGLLRRLEHVDGLEPERLSLDERLSAARGAA